MLTRVGIRSRTVRFDLRKPFDVLVKMHVEGDVGGRVKARNSERKAGQRFFGFEGGGFFARSSA